MDDTKSDCKSGEQKERTSDICKHVIPTNAYTFGDCKICGTLFIYHLQTVNAKDADVIFKSSDGVLFRIHKKNLETSTGGFPPSDFPTLDENVDLTEESGILDILFMFIYPRRHPSLLGLDFSVLEKVAEASEKYEVFAAMNICHTRMSDNLQEHPIELLNYSTRHGYWDLADEAAPLTITQRHDIIGKTMNMQILGIWLQYNQLWTDIITNVENFALRKARHRDDWYGNSPPVFTGFVEALNVPEGFKAKLREALHRGDHLSERQSSNYLITSNVNGDELTDMFNTVPKFSDIINSK